MIKIFAYCIRILEIVYQDLYAALFTINFSKLYIFTRGEFLKRISYKNLPTPKTNLSIPKIKFPTSNTNLSTPEKIFQLKTQISQLSKKSSNSQKEYLKTPKNLLTSNNISQLPKKFNSQDYLSSPNTNLSTPIKNLYFRKHSFNSQKKSQIPNQIYQLPTQISQPKISPYFPK